METRKDSISRYEGTLSRTAIRGNSNYTVITVLTIMVARAVNINDRSDHADADGDNSCIVTFIRMSCFVGVPIKWRAPVCACACAHARACVTNLRPRGYV